MSYHVVLDLEMCRVPRGCRTAEYRWANETIQIGAVLLDDDYNIIDRFDSYVKPEYGKLDGYIKDFTGITEKDIASAPKMEDALKMFSDWIPDGVVEMVSWSDSDQKQLLHELWGKGICNERMAELLDAWNDCQITFSEIMNSERRYALSEALIAADILQEGEAHNGYCDAYNTALLFAKMRTEKVFKMNRIFEEARSEECNHLSCNLGDLLKNFDFALCVG